MSIIRICDSCKKEIKLSEQVQFFGSRVLSEVTFCETCFKEVENFVVNKYSLTVQLTDHEQRIGNLESSPKP